MTSYSPHLVLTDHEDAARSDWLDRVVPREGSTLHLDTVNIELVGVSEVVVGDADVSPEVEGRYLPVPPAVLRSPLAGSEGKIYLGETYKF